MAAKMANEAFGVHRVLVFARQSISMGTDAVVVQTVVRTWARTSTDVDMSN
jgi:hypothetical protein